ncbi:hypothetical protein OQA88_4861 [Cercophora sp. LCS_1]
MRVVQKPPCLQALSFPGLHPAIKTFAHHGILQDAIFDQAFAYLGGTSLGRQFGVPARRGTNPGAGIGDLQRGITSYIPKISKRPVQRRDRCLALILFHGANALAVLSSTTECPSAERIEKELGPKLSVDAEILTPRSPGWEEEVVARSSAPRIHPSFVLSVHVATAEDVEAVVKYANHIHTPFLAVSGAHGWPTDMNRLQGGIQINLRKLNTTRISQDGDTAAVAGGTLQHEAVRSLYAQGKKMAGPLLGGGHSMLQGQHGFAADNLVSARLVLANGSAVTVSATENPDLFWAIRGAGHNFGIATSLRVKVYDASKDWTLLTFVFTQDKLEAYFDTWNALEAEHDDAGGLLVLNGLFARNPAADAINPVIILQIFYTGDDNPLVDIYRDAFLALRPLVNTSVSSIAYVGLYKAGGLDISSSVCRKNENLAGFPNSVARWHAGAMRKGFNLFAELTADETFNTSAFILESYGRHGVRAVPPNENAVAPEERTLHLLGSPLLWWVGHDPKNREKAVSYGKRMQDAVRGSNPPHAYVNYAVGTEPLDEMYGRDEERIERLRRLKREYDPLNRFGFYNPIS